MARRRSSFGFLGRFGRSEDLRRLDAALRAVDLHPALVPEGVKLALVNLLKDQHGDEPPLKAYAPAAALFAYLRARRRRICAGQWRRGAGRRVGAG
jgi:hypothetical protein